MNRLSVVLLLGVGVFITCVVTLMVVKARGVRPLTNEVTASKADFRIKEVHLQEADEGNVRWKLDADQAEVFEQDGKTLMRKVTITVFQPERTWTITGDEGDLANASKDVRLRGNVVVVSTDGVRIQTKSLNWAARPRHLWTEDPVSIARGETSIEGQGLAARVDEERAVVKGRVQVVIPYQKTGPSVLSQFNR